MRKQRAPQPAGFNPATFARRIRQLIEREGQSLRTVATEAGVDCGVLSRLGTRETTEPRLVTLWSLADYFNVTLDYLSGRARDEEAELQLWDTWQALAPQQRTELLRHARAMLSKSKAA